MLHIYVEADINCFFKLYFSNYSHYYSYVLQVTAHDQMQLQYYQYTKLQCIETTIWPLLYLKESWYESNILGHVRMITF